MYERDQGYTDHQTFENILNHASDEIFVLNKERKIIYVNAKSEQHYGLKPEEILGRYDREFVEKGYWRPSLVDEVFEKKQPITRVQTTYIGTELMTTAIPIINHDEVEVVVYTSQRVQDFQSLKELESDSHPDYTRAENIITDSEEMKRVIRLANKAAHVDSTVLLQGESGTGKGLLANFVHSQSKRYQKPLLTINCAAIPDELLESELFGYDPGAFTGASKKGKRGLLETADQGTVFLDEISEIPLKLQAKLLQFIQDQQFIPVGSDVPKKVDVRIIVASNKDLEEWVKEKKFREDLYYRINVIELEIPPLRERPKDVIPLIYYSLNQFNRKHKENKSISHEAIQLLASYSWPGNIRELQNVMERSVVMSDAIIQSSDLPKVIRHQSKPMTHFFPYDSLDSALDEVEKNIVLQSYRQNPSTRKMATDLKISQSRASNLIRKYKH